MGEAIRAKVVAFVAELFQTHCDVSAAPETIDLYASAVLDGSLSVDAVAAQIRELGKPCKFSTNLSQYIETNIC